jgi:hypothetical protein
MTILSPWLDNALVQCEPDKSKVVRSGHYVTASGKVYTLSRPGFKMTVTAKALLGFLLFALLCQIWLFRLDVQTNGSGLTVTINDRWLGKVVTCTGSRNCIQQYPRIEKDPD